MHGLNLFEKSCMSNSWSKQLILQSQDLSTYFHKSTRPKDALRKAAEICNAPNRLPQPACQTRFSSLGTSIEILIDLQEPIEVISLRRELNIPARIVSIAQDPTYWEGLKAMHPILGGFTNVTKAIQRMDATAADVVRYIIYLTHILEQSKKGIPPGKHILQHS